MLDSNWEELKEWDRRLVARQVIGFIQLVELPAYERYLFARDQVGAAASGKKIEVERAVNYKYDTGSFPDFSAALIKSHSGFGFETYSSVNGRAATLMTCDDYNTYVEQKQQTCRSYVAAPKAENRLVCDRLK